MYKMWVCCKLCWNFFLLLYSLIVIPHCRRCPLLSYSKPCVSHCLTSSQTYLGPKCSRARSPFGSLSVCKISAATTFLWGWPGSNGSDFPNRRRWEAWPFLWSATRFNRCGSCLDKWGCWNWELCFWLLDCTDTQGSSCISEQPSYNHSLRMEGLMWI